MENPQKHILIKKSDITHPVSMPEKTSGGADVFSVISREQIRRISLFSPNKAEQRRGSDLESDIFGLKKIEVNSKEYQDEFLKFGGKNREEIYKDIIGFKEATSLVKEFQPWNPVNPLSDFAKRLREKVIEKLGINAKEAEKIKIYSARGSHLDYKGIDGFIELEDERGIKRVTYDASLRDKAEIKADMLIGDFPDPLENNQAYLELIDSYAEETAARIQAAPYEKPYDINLKNIQPAPESHTGAKYKERPDISRYT